MPVASLHVAFDSYLWCMDEELKVHVSTEGLKEWQGREVTLSVGKFAIPSAGPVLNYTRQRLPREQLNRERKALGKEGP